jgi:glucose-specific phosphotransferase system IIA component
MTISYKSPIQGIIKPIEDTPDDVFSKKLLGDGFAIYPIDAHITAPLHGVIHTIYPTKHIIILKHHDVYVMLHLGMKARHEIVTWHVEVGDSIYQGEPIGVLNSAFFEQEKHDQVINVVFLEKKKITLNQTFIEFNE